MPLPDGVDTVTLTAGKPLSLPDGTPFQGKVLVAGPDVVTVRGEKVVLGGEVPVPVVDGLFSVELAAPDTDGMDPFGWPYRITAVFENAPGWVRWLTLTKANPNPTLAELADADPATGSYVTLADPSTMLARAANLADLPDPAQARTNLGIGAVDTSALLAKTANLADVEDAATARANLGAAAAATALTKTANLSDLDNTGTARTNLGLGAAAVASIGTAAGTVAAGNDSRLSDPRTPLAHAASHQSAGSDPLVLAQAQVSGLPLSLTSWRRRHLPDPVVADSLYAGAAPTISTAQTTTPTTGYVKYAPAGVALTGTDVTAPFAYMGAGNFAIGATSPDTSYVLPLSRYPWTYASGQAVWSVEFGTDSQVFQIRVKWLTSSMFRLSVDGRRVTDLMQAVAGTTAGSGHLITVDLGSATPRRIRIDFYSFPFGGIYLPAGATMWSVAPAGGRTMGFGDSLTDGSAYNTGGGAGTWLHRAARLFGCTDVWEQGRGGTGYVTAGSYATFADRVQADVIAWAPTRLYVWGGYNDNGGSQTAISTAAASLYATIKTALPLCETYVIGCWSPTGSPGASLTTTDATLRAAAAAAGLPFISPQSGAVYDASGALLATQGAWITSGNAAGYVNATDSVHPNDAGHAYLARRITDATRLLLAA
ncbi:SGNH/GDSL hydrolase family protein [Streptomyces sp. NPDC090306]|uniref:SGNH/GDSL hydrolase family protein n=1 Tax=Streptomyces sp. NPDC090306 TaxID=3365961 RepID=UPI00382D9F3C